MGEPPPPHRVIRHPGADADIEQIVEYIGEVKKAPANARRYAAKLIGTCDRLDIFPDAYTQVKPPPPRPVYRYVVDGTYLLLYEVFPNERVVRVLYVWHGARRPPNFRRQRDPLPSAP